MEATLIRVGNDEYAKNNGSYGLTTLRDRHASIGRGRVTLEFRGKSGVKHEFEVNDPRLAAIARRCQDLPGQELFQYLDENGKACDVGSADVNAYLRLIAGRDFTAKDFRTWAGTVLAAQALLELSKADGATSATKKNVVRAVEVVAGKLGNTKTVCRKCYIHPEIINAYLDGALIENLATRARQMAGSMRRLRPEEAGVLRLLQRRLAEAKTARAKRPKSVVEALRRSIRLAERRRAS
jgi:DNA topoisomerase-1